MIHIALLAASFIASSGLIPDASAGTNVGNGGEGVLCEPWTRESRLRFLDHVEWETQTPYRVDFPGESPSPEIRAWNVIERLKPHDPVMADYLEKTFRKLRIERVASGSVPVVQDRVTSLKLKRGCRFISIAFQPNRTFRSLRRGPVKLDGDLYDWLTVEGRAGLLLHETLIRLAATQGWLHRTDTIRKFGFMISSTGLTRLTRREYLQMLEAMGVWQAIPTFGHGIRFFHHWKDSIRF